jgi:tetratricopeptide (TPR) repeat protein
MKSYSVKTIVPIVVIVLGFAAVFGLSGYLEKRRPPLPAGFEDSDLALQGARLKGYALGFEGLIADWYWMKSLQYIGDKIVNTDKAITIDNMSELNPRLLYPYLDNATALDARFTSVYEYGATVLPAIDNAQAVKLGEKGIRDNPNEWRLHHYLGFTYWRLKDYEKAADVYERGSQIAGAPDFMRLMAAKMKSEGGSREIARHIYRQMFDEAGDAKLKESAGLRLLELDSLDERDAIQKVLQDFQAKNNRCANNWREILPLLQTVKLPNARNFRVNKSNELIDPTDAPYVLDRENCAVKLDLDKTKIPLK